MNRVIFSSVRTDWETPDSVFKPLHEEFNFTLDVCASAENAKVPRFLAKNDDMIYSWANERCWMNPPYGREIVDWVRKASFANTLVVGLLPARTDTAWWHEWVQGKAEIRFVRGRIKFVGAKHSAPFPSAIVIWRPSESTS